MTYALINDTEDFIWDNKNLFYQALFMSCAMGAIESVMMLSDSSMKTRCEKNLFLFLLIFALLTLICIRYQIGIDSNDFLKSMIPHHSMAILMVKEVQPKTTDPQILTLMQNIVQSQEHEIQVMKSLLKYS